MKSLKKLLTGIAICLGLATLTLAFTLYSGSPSNEILEIGKKAPDMDLLMKDVSEKEVSLKSIAKENGLLVIFSCNTCPFVIGNGTRSEGWEGRYPEIYDLADASGIGMVLVNPNEAKRDNGDSFKDMQDRYKDKGFKGYYVLDTNHVLADAFGALTTPHVFLFDKNMNLVYRGAIDDSVDSSEDVKEPWLKNAINALKNDTKIEPNSTRQLGCSIKRVKV